MRLSLVSFLAILAPLAPIAQATIYITFPVAESSISSGDPNVNVTWRADPTTDQPLASTFGETRIYLAIGSSTVQTNLQLLATIDDPVNVTSARIRVNATRGEDSDMYFLKFVSKNNITNGVPLTAYSARFRLTGMAGNFSADVKRALASVEGSSITATVPSSEETGDISNDEHEASRTASSTRSHTSSEATETPTTSINYGSAAREHGTLTGGMTLLGFAGALVLLL